MNKKTIRHIFAAVCAFVLCYLSAAFVLADIDFTNWEWYHRIITLASFLFVWWFFEFVNA